MRLMPLVAACVLLAGCTTPPTADSTPGGSTSSATTFSTAPISTPEAPTTSSTSTTPPISNASLIVVDVGQGSAAVLRTPGGVLVYDAANRFASNYQPLLDVLTGIGVTMLTHLVISHADADHSGGCVPLFTNFQVERFYHPGYTHTTQTWSNCLAAAASEGAAIFTDAELDPGDQFNIDDTTVATVVYLNAAASDPNKSSLSLRIDYGAVSFLMVGDTDCAMETQILQGGLNVDVDILEVGHHGSHSSTCADWLDATTPGLAYISAGAGNQFGHPRQEVLDRLEARSIPVVRTDLHGHITIETDGSTYSYTMQTN